MIHIPSNTFELRCMICALRKCDTLAAGADEILGLTDDILKSFHEREAHIQGQILEEGRRREKWEA